MKNQLENSFPKTDDVIKFINEISNINLNEISYEELEARIHSNFRYIPITDCFIPAETNLFRARVNQNNVPYSLVKDIYLPPKKLIDKYGRANRPGQQIFYCASNYKLASFEVIQDLKNSFSPAMEVAYLTVGIWKTKSKLHLANIIDSPFLHQLRDDIKKHYKKIQSMLNNGNLSKELVDSNNLISQFFSDEFTKEEIKSHLDYKISALYANSIIAMNKIIAKEYSKEKFDGINYPSVAMKYKGDNQAIFPNSAQSKLELTNSIQVLCGNLNFEKGDFTGGIIHEAESIENGNIKWKDEIYKAKS
jgi:hypothetical protein